MLNLINPTTTIDMTNNNWIEEFDEKFYNNDSNQDCGWLCDMMQGGDKCDAIKDFISNLLTQKDQEHKAELEMIKEKVQNMREKGEGDLRSVISILDSQINKLSTE